MGGTTVMVEAKTEQEVNEQLEEHKKQAEKVGLMDERTRFVGYDKQQKVWRGYIWLHS